MPGSPDAGANLMATSVIWEWVGVDQRAVVWPPQFATGRWLGGSVTVATDDSDVLTPTYLPSGVTAILVRDDGIV